MELGDSDVVAENNAIYVMDNQAAPCIVKGLTKYYGSFKVSLCEIRSKSVLLINCHE